MADESKAAAGRMFAAGRNDGLIADVLDAPSDNVLRTRASVAAKRATEGATLAKENALRAERDAERAELREKSGSANSAVMRAWENFANAIVASAANDYRSSALKLVIAQDELNQANARIEGASDVEARADAMQAAFLAQKRVRALHAARGDALSILRSEWCAQLTSACMPHIIRELDAEREALTLDETRREARDLKRRMGIANRALERAVTDTWKSSKTSGLKARNKRQKIQV